MPEREVHICQCPECLGGNTSASQKRHQQMNLLLSRLDEQQRRWYAAVEADKVGHGGIRLLTLITGLDEKTIVRGREEMAAAFPEAFSEDEWWRISMANRKAERWRCG